MPVKQCAYCGDVLLTAQASTQEPAHVPVRLQVSEGPGNLVGRYEFCGVNCLAFWCDDVVKDD